MISSSKSMDATHLDAEIYSDSESETEQELETLFKDGEMKDTNRTLSIAESDRMGVSIYNEVMDAFYNARYLGVFMMFIGLYIGYVLTIKPYDMASSLDKSFQNIHDLGLIRPVLNDDQQAILKHNIMHGETSFELPEPYFDHVKLRFHRNVDKSGSFEPPQIFYDGVIFGLTEENSHSLRYTGHKDYYAERSLLEEKQDLESTIKSMRPTPSLIIPRTVSHNTTGWEEGGYAIYFSYDDLKKQGKLSSDKLEPWKRVAEEVLSIARDFKQVYVTAWYPHVYGHPGEDEAEKKKHRSNPNRYTTILQQILPTRTGLHGITSKVPMWMSGINYNKPKRKLASEIHSEKEWSEEDHWSMYKPGGTKYKKYTKKDLEVMDYVLHKGVKGVNSGDVRRNEDIDLSINIQGF